MTLDDVRVTISAMKTSAAAEVRLYGHLLGVEATFVDAICAALGDISVDEALDALSRESFHIRQSIINENRAAD